MIFPTLKTGAVAQYPLERSLRFSTMSVRFLNGTRQRFRLLKNGLRRWVVKLDQLDEQELAAVISFVDQQNGTAFAFTDPISGSVVANCIIAGESFEAAMTGVTNGQVTILIEEVP